MTPKTSANPAALPAKTSRTLAVKRRQPAPAPAPPAPAEIEVPEPDPVLISHGEVESLAVEIAALHVQMQEHGHDLMGLMRLMAKNAYGLDLPALPIEILDDLDQPGEYTTDELGLVPSDEPNPADRDPLEDRVAALETDVNTLKGATAATRKDLAETNGKVGALSSDINAVRKDLAAKADKHAGKS